MYILHFCFYGDMAVAWVYGAGFSGCSCVLMDEMVCFELLSFYVSTDVMWVYTVGADGQVLSCLGGLFFVAFCCGRNGHALIFCCLLVSV
jgi:hypothetical protein